MNATNIVAWHINGCCVCPKCIHADDRKSDEAHPVFADSLSSEVGATCDTCRKYLGPDGEWESDADAWPWAPSCPHCGSTRPLDRDDWCGPEKIYCIGCQKTYPCIDVGNEENADYLCNEAVRDMTSQGACDAAVRGWATRLGATGRRSDMIDLLAKTGGWTRDEMADTPIRTLIERCLWALAGQARDMGLTCECCSERHTDLNSEDLCPACQPSEPTAVPCVCCGAAIDGSDDCNGVNVCNRCIDTAGRP